MPAPAFKRAWNKKPVAPADSVTALLQLDAVAEHRQEWAEAAKRDGMSLTEWVTAKLNSAAARILAREE